MKFLASILLVIISFFLVQPVFVSSTKNECLKKCCTKGNAKKECSKHCNPLFTCMYCQYLPAKNIKINSSAPVMFTEYHTDFNAGILKGYLSDCWHPPSTLT